MEKNTQLTDEELAQYLSGKNDKNDEAAIVGKIASSDLTDEDLLDIAEGIKEQERATHTSSRAVWYRAAAAVAVILAAGGVWIGLSSPTGDGELTAQTGNKTTDTILIHEEQRGDILYATTPNEGNNEAAPATTTETPEAADHSHGHELRCIVPEQWIKGADLVFSWRCNTPDVCFQIRPTGTTEWSTRKYDSLDKNSDILPAAMQRGFLTHSATLEWRLTARFPDDVTTEKTGFVTITQ